MNSLNKINDAGRIGHDAERGYRPISRPCWSAPPARASFLGEPLHVARGEELVEAVAGEIDRERAVPFPEESRHALKVEIVHAVSLLARLLHGMERGINTAVRELGDDRTEAQALSA